MQIILYVVSMARYMVPDMLTIIDIGIMIATIRLPDVHLITVSWQS